MAWNLNDFGAFGQRPVQNVKLDELSTIIEPMVLTHTHPY